MPRMYVAETDDVQSVVDSILSRKGEINLCGVGAGGIAIAKAALQKARQTLRDII